MTSIVAAFTTLVLVVLAPAAAPAQDRGGVLDILRDVLQGDQRLQGHVVVARPGDLIVRGQDGRTYHVDTAGVDRSQVQSLQSGQPVVVETRGATRDGVVQARSIQPGSGERKSFATAEGTVVSIEGARVTFRTDSGFTIPADLSQIVGRQPALTPNQRATLYYEQGPSTIAALWVEPSSMATSGAWPSASPGSQPYGGSPSASPGTAGTGIGYQRLHGYVESVGISSLSLKTDDGRTVTVETAQVADDMRRSLRPGDVVSVVGKAQGDNRFVAELIQRDR